MASFTPRYSRHSLREIANRLGLDTDAPADDTSAASANADGDIIQRLEYIQGIIPYIGTPGSFNPILGYKVTKTGDIAATTDPLFDVTGKCLIRLFIGEVSSVLATSSSLSLNTSTNGEVIAASTQITTDALGTLYSVAGDIDLGLNGGGTPAIDSIISKSGTYADMIVNDDQIRMNLNAAGTGKIDWELWYFPLEASASVVAAA